MKALTGLLSLFFFLITPVTNADGAVLSLVVSFADEQSIEKALAQLCEVAEKKNVIVGEILILGYREQSLKEHEYFRSKYEIPDTVNLALEGKDFLRQFRRAAKAAEHADARAQLSEPDKESLVETALTTQLLAKYGLEPLGSASTVKALTHFGINSLPAWVISDGDKDYVYQRSNASPSRLFTARGEFINGNSTAAPGQFSRRYIFEELNHEVVNQTFSKPAASLLKLSPSSKESVFFVDCSNLAE